MIISNAPDLADDGIARWGFPDQRLAVSAFTDLMTGALEAVMVQQHLQRPQAVLQAISIQGRYR